MNLISVERVDSTNTWIKAHPELEMPVAVIAHSQDAGRGQRGNSWESAPGENITMSCAVCPEGVQAREQFILSCAVSLAIIDTLKSLLPRFAEEFSVKWPNDIYFRNRKICGILIENSLSGTQIIRSIIGIGLNVNQTTFLSDAPNPVSMATVANRSFHLTEVAATLLESLERRLLTLDTMPHSAILKQYMAQIYRRTGMHQYSDTAGNLFSAEIVEIEPSGLLHLRHSDGSLTIHPFKTVQFILPSSPDL